MCVNFGLRIKSHKEVTIQPSFLDSLMTMSIVHETMYHKIALIRDL